MGDILRSKRRILTAGLGAAAFTALEGLACGNPVEPRCPGSPHCMSSQPPEPEVVVPAADAAPAETAPATDAGAAPVPIDASVAPADTTPR